MMHDPRISTVLLLPLLAAPVTAQRLLEAPTKTADSAFAVIVDQASYSAVEPAIRAYRDAVEEDGLATWIVVDHWENPEELRELLRELHLKRPALEGALFVGDVPVPMLRDAQHLTSAFKMDPVRFPRRRSSVPSDRFYEDFDLAFSSLGPDEEDGRLFYYSLLPESAQRVEKEIYTARLMPPAEGEPGHAMIRACLQRFVEQKREGEDLDRALTFMGHGYVSEARSAWDGMRRALEEELPRLFVPGGRLVSYHHERSAELKSLLLRELGDQRLDLALLHHHGAVETQYLLGSPELSGIAAQVEELQRYLRGRLRRAREREKPEAEEQIALMERWRVPLSWFEGAFDEEQTLADEAWAAREEISAAELEGFACGAEVLVLDSCFNGCFFERPCIAGQYLFGSGELAVCVANTVNIAQDVWADRDVGLLAEGERVGVWHRRRPHLESHLLGDPTFRFRGTTTARARRNDKSAKLLWNSSSGVDRLTALSAHALERGPALENVLPEATRDPFELLRRTAVSLMGDVGHQRYLEPLLRAALRDPSERVVFDARGAVKKFDRDEILRVAGPLLDAESALRGGAEWRASTERSLLPSSWIDEDLQRAADREAETAKRIRSVRSFRLYRVHRAVPVLCELASRADDDEELRRNALETLGWFVFFHDRATILKTCAAIEADEASPAVVRAEARKSRRRIEAGANDPLLP